MGKEYISPKQVRILLRILVALPVLILLTSLLLITSVSHSVSQPLEGSNWMHPAYDQMNSGFSPQTVINRDNLDSLELKWVFQVPGFFGQIPGAPGEGGEDEHEGEEEHEADFGFEIPHVPTGIQTVPLVVNGIVYIASDFNGLFAIRAETNDLLWRFSPPIATFGEKPWWNRVFAQHGIDFHDGKIWMQASDCTIYGLDPISGDTLVEIPDTCNDIPGNTGVYFGSFAPLFYNDLIITRPSGGAGSTGERGFISAYDINTEELVWRWFAVPPTGGDPNWDFEDAGKGNIVPFAGDWGNNDIVGGGSVWSLIALDEESQTIYFPTTAPTVDLDASLRPGPNLYSSSIVALDVLTGEMKWYYQIVPHDINFHESRWSIIHTEIDFQGSPRNVIIAGAKTNLVHVLDAESGDPIYAPVRVGPPSKNSVNADAGNEADLQASQRPLIRQEVCPGFQGGIDSAPSFSENTIFVATQTFCTSFIEEEGHPFKGNEVDIIHHVAGPGYFGSFHPGNSSLFAIDASNGRIKWVYEMQNRQQYGAVTSSGGVVFVPDRLGVVHGVDAETGELIRKWDFGGLGGAGVSLGATARGEMMLFIASGGSGEFGVRTTGILSAFGLPSDSSPVTPPIPPSPISGNAVSFLGFGIAVVAVLYAMVLTRRRK